MSGEPLTLRELLTDYLLPALLALLLVLAALAFIGSVCSELGQVQLGSKVTPLTLAKGFESLAGFS